MHKRARNHRQMIKFKQGKDFTLGQIVTNKWKMHNPNYEPQGKCEAKKYAKRLVSSKVTFAIVDDDNSIEQVLAKDIECKPGIIKGED